MLKGLIGRQKRVPFEDDPKPMCNLSITVRKAVDLPNTDSDDLKVSSFARTHAQLSFRKMGARIACATDIAAPFCPVARNPER